MRFLRRKGAPSFVIGTWGTSSFTACPLVSSGMVDYFYARSSFCVLYSLVFWDRNLCPSGNLCPTATRTGSIRPGASLLSRQVEPPPA